MPDSPKFDSEASLRETMAELLRRIPNIADVQVLHGRREYGKDIVFQTPDPLGHRSYCACVMKNARISGTVDRSSGARAVMLQAEQALDTPFIDATGQEISIRHVYVVTPEDITQEAMASIQGALKSRSGQITFLAGAQFFTLIRDYWPDFFRDEFAILEHTIRSLTERGLTGELHEAAANYGFRPPEESEKTVYVERTLSSTIYSYDDTPFRSRAPQHHGPDASEWIAFLHRVAQSLPHLRKWSFATAGSDEDLSRLPSLLEDHVRELSDEYRKQKEDEVLRAQAEGRKPAETTIRERNSRLAQRAESICRLVEVTLQPLLVANKEASHVVLTDDSTLSVLQTSPAMKAGTLADCLTAAPAVLLGSGDSRTLRGTEQEIRSSQQSWLVVGPAGYGKTSFCRWNALVDAERYRRREATTYPVYVPLHALSLPKLKSFNDAFLGTAGQSALLPDRLTVAAPGGARQTRLYLDGLDEVASPETRRIIVGLARDAFQAGIQIILTSRDYIRMPELTWLPRISLDMLDEHAQAALVNQLLGSDGRREKFVRQLRLTPALHAIFGVPLMARLILLVYRETGEVPENRSRLYRTFVDLLLGGWDLAKRVVRDSRFGRSIKTNILCKLAHNVHFERLRIFGISTVHEAVRACASRLDLHEINALCGELVRDGVLSHSANTFYFSHLSFQEFLCASYCQGSPSMDEADAILARCLAGDEWWSEVLAFYIGLSDSPDRVADWLAHRRIEDGGRGGRILSLFYRAFPRYRPD